MNGNSSGFAEELIRGSFVNILKPPPATNVINQNGIESTIVAYHILQELTETVPAFENDPTLGPVGVGLNNLEVVCFGIALDCDSLVVKGILLMFSGHPKVLSSGNQIGNHGALLKKGYRLKPEEL